jgi:hypothetical protein
MPPQKKKILESFTYNNVRFSKINTNHPEARRVEYRRLGYYTKVRNNVLYISDTKSPVAHLRSLKKINNEKLKKDIRYVLNTDKGKLSLLIPSYGMTWRLFDYPKNYDNKKRRIHTQKSTIIDYLGKSKIKQMRKE